MLMCKQHFNRALHCYFVTSPIPCHKLQIKTTVDAQCSFLLATTVHVSNAQTVLLIMHCFVMSLTLDHTELKKGKRPVIN